MSIKILSGDCRTILPTLPADSVHCCVTSPPYWGLRDYGIPPTVWGGDPACEHVWGGTKTAERHAKIWASNSPIENRPPEHQASVSQGAFCRRCGAWRGAFGLEPTYQLYVEHAVEVFREVRRVLRPDGTLWLNLGDSYSGGKTGRDDNSGADLARRAATYGAGTGEGRGPSSGKARPPMSDRLNFLASDLKGRVFFYGGANPIRRSAERINVLLYDKATPDLEFSPLFAAQRISVKQGQDHLCQIGGFFDPPVLCCGTSSLRGRIPYGPDGQGFVDLPENVGIIVTAGDLYADAALCKAAALAIKNGKTSLAIKITGEPIPEGVACGVPIWDAVTLNSGPEGAAKVDPVDEPISLLDRPEFLASRGHDFSIREASSEHVALALHRGCQLSFLRVSHLFASGNGLTPYIFLLDQAQRKANAGQAKQELGIPEMVKRALMEDGWICRQTIIWSKPNPMPESVTDRCTKAHEYLFLLTKSARYFYDGDAIREAYSEATFDRQAYGWESTGNRLQRHQPGVKPRDDGQYSKLNSAGRNKRSVWEIATSPFPEAHFATFPPALVEPCIKAGTSEKGCCGKCGAPRERVIETTYRNDTTKDGRPAQGNNTKDGAREAGSRTMASGVRTRRHDETLGWQPTCTCHGHFEERDGTPDWISEQTGERKKIMVYVPDQDSPPPKPCTVLDPFGGAGTTGLVADRLQRNAILIELNPTYAEMVRERIFSDAPLFAEAAE